MDSLKMEYGCNHEGKTQFWSLWFRNICKLGNLAIEILLKVLIIRNIVESSSQTWDIRSNLKLNIYFL